MAMTVLNNTAAQMTLGELNKNISRVGKDLMKLSKAERYTSFGDGASDVAISEKMRELIRSLGQNERNVQTGANLLKVAEGGVEEQLHILRTIKQKVLDAANDTNTDADRTIIQKEIDQGFEQIEHIAQTTTYNGRRLLAGDVTDIRREMVIAPVPHTVIKPSIPTWRQLDEVTYLEDSDAGLIADKYATLDGVEGPFDVFDSMNTATLYVDIPSLGLKGSDNKFSGGADGVPKTIEFDLAGNPAYTTPQDLEGKGFSLGSQYYVFRYDTSIRYNTNDSNFRIIDISGATDLSTVANRARNIINIYNPDYTAAVTGTKFKFSTKNNADTAENINSTAELVGAGAPASSTQIDVPGTGSAATYGTVNETLLVNPTYVQSGSLTGGVDYVAPTYGTKEVPINPNDPDASGTRPVTDYSNVKDPGAGAYASVTLNLSNAVAGSRATNNQRAGTTLQIGNGNNSVLLQFVDGSSSPTEVMGTSNGINSTQASPRIFTVGINYRSSVSQIGSTGIGIDMSRGLSNVVFRANNMGVSFNGQPITQVYRNVPYQISRETAPAVAPDQVPVDLNSISPLDTTGMVVTNSEQGATFATFDMNFSNIDDIESVIDELDRKSIFFSNGEGFSFVDYMNGKISSAINSLPSRTTKVDLNELRSLSGSEGDNLKALQKFMKNKLSKEREITNTDSGVRISALTIGTPGNNETMYTHSSGTLRHIDIDFSGKTPKELIGKGFRVYCATDENEWWNFQLTDAQDSDFEKQRPSGTTGTAIKTIRIDISEAKNGADVVKAIYDQASPKLTTVYDHHLRMEANPNAGILRLYDKRTQELNNANGYNTLMGKGGPDDTKGWWKIADGAVDDVEVYLADGPVIEYSMEEVPIQVASKDFVIHDGPHANQRLFLKLPQTTLDKVLDFDKSEQSAKDFNVMSKEMRDKLLGKRQVSQGEDPEIDGVLDKGIRYLTDSQVLLGSERQRLKLSEDNIANKIETATKSESTIRDADMAKEMISYTKNSIMMQASQAMVSQANQTGASVLSLLH